MKTLIKNIVIALLMIAGFTLTATAQRHGKGYNSQKGNRGYGYGHYNKPRPYGNYYTHQTVGYNGYGHGYVLPAATCGHHGCGTSCSHVVPPPPVVACGSPAPVWVPGFWRYDPYRCRRVWIAGYWY